MERNFCKKVLMEGGDLVPLILPYKDTGGTGLMNPSIFVYRDELIVNIRHINYTLWHSEGEQLFNNKWGPLAYLHPENDLHLKTNNFICFLDDNLNITKYHKVEMTLDVPDPMWEFHGLEDARLTEWNDKLYMSGVRRDTTPNGEGRIELSKIIIYPDSIKEISRLRIEPPGEYTYCEKNWMPVLDTPYTYIKWSNPIQVVKVNLNTHIAENVYIGSTYVPNMPDFRGGSQIINWMGFKMGLTHEVNLFNNRLGQKDATYMHRMLLWDNEWNLVSMSKPFSFMTGEIEFVAGMALYNNSLLISFGFQDNSAFILRIPEEKIEELFELKHLFFDWGMIKENKIFMNNIRREVFFEDCYQKTFKVEENDIVVDIGASVGPFAYSILENKPKHIYCIEPNKDLFKTLLKNFKDVDNVTCINKGISQKDGNTETDNLFDNNEPTLWGKHQMDGITLKTLMKDYILKDLYHSISSKEKINFLKIDCEGGEYDFFTKENHKWIKNNIEKISGEFHTRDRNEKNKFIKFRDLYLKDIEYRAYTYDNENITIDIWENDFIDILDYFNIYIDYR